METANGKKLWFRRKLFGWGWTPITWQGWVIVGVYTFLIGYIFARIAVRSTTTLEILGRVWLPFVALTAILMAICFAKGEKPRWQWSKRIEDAPEEEK